ncbi:DivIVA domain-containing protein [Micromonospora sp. NPDC049559]|uniref:DivIVA domain-containing protein n=1 Tax=Micromonospora sp. NPDC049559 TaxID=3155923 RepID=UPI00343F4495
MNHPSVESFTPGGIRAITFGVRRRGLDPDEVYAYLGALADELERLHRELITARTQSERMRQGLRQWQARHVGCRFDDPYWPKHEDRRAR